MKKFKCKIRLNFLKPNICSVLNILNKHRNILFIQRCNFYENVGQKLFSIRYSIRIRNTPDLKLRNQNKVSSEKVQIQNLNLNQTFSGYNSSWLNIETFWIEFLSLQNHTYFRHEINMSKIANRTSNQTVQFYFHLVQ